MQKLANWLTASVFNSALLASLLFMVALPLSAAICVLNVLARGTPIAAQVVVLVAAIQGLVAFILLRVFGEATGTPFGSALAAVALLAPAVLVGEILRRVRSTTLAVQVVSLLALGAVVILAAGPLDLQAWFEPAFVMLEEAERSAGGAENVGALVRSMIGPFLPVVVAGAFWLSLMIAMYLGYAMHAGIAAEGFALGRFRELNLGRIIAGVMVAVSVLATLTQSVLAANMALLLLLAFAVQGFALLHWLVRERGLSLWILAMFYLLLVLFPPVFMMLALPIAVAGYIDAWFNLRPRFANAGAN